jgi:hypothetical protein
MSTTFRIQLETPAITDQTIYLNLYLHDNSLADAPAALAANCHVQIQTDESFAEIAMDPDMTIKQAGRSWDEMAMPCLYVALDVGKSTVTYFEGPVFGCSLDLWRF